MGGRATRSGRAGYRRWYSSALVRLAEAQAAVGRHDAALRSLDDSVEVIHALSEQIPTAGLRVDARKAIESALRVVVQLPVDSSAERRRWTGFAVELGVKMHGVLEGGRV